MRWPARPTAPNRGRGCASAGCAGPIHTARKLERSAGRVANARVGPRVAPGQPCPAGGVPKPSRALNLSPNSARIVCRSAPGCPVRWRSRESGTLHAADGVIGRADFEARPQNGQALLRVESSRTRASPGSRSYRRPSSPAAWPSPRPGRPGRIQPWAREFASIAAVSASLISMSAYAARART